MIKPAERPAARAMRPAFLTATEGVGNAIFD